MNFRKSIVALTVLASLNVAAEDGIPTPILEPGERLKFSTDVKVSAFNKAMENNGSNSFRKTLCLVNGHYIKKVQLQLS
ncbi:hypothetical protein [Colwellia sp. 75C3]|uniref:hypothetical protein n=1 Tax=Colwellia sp. 75C3 TaxID=888425 RepID=UPI0018E2CA63|nr:hypothetical protein [Colwellia sp. 75C3]